MVRRQMRVTRKQTAWPLATDTPVLVCSGQDDAERQTIAAESEQRASCDCRRSDCGGLPKNMKTARALVSFCRSTARFPKFGFRPLQILRGMTTGFERRKRAARLANISSIPRSRPLPPQKLFTTSAFRKVSAVSRTLRGTATSGGFCGRQGRDLGIELIFARRALLFATSKPVSISAKKFAMSKPNFGIAS